MQFSIRDVLWLTVVAALALGWGIDRARVGRELRGAHRQAAQALAEAALAQHEALVTRELAASLARQAAEQAAKAAQDPPQQTVTAP